MNNKGWIIKVFILTFILSVLFSYFTNFLSLRTNTIVTVFIILFVIAIGVGFDLVGSSTLASEEKNFHAMSSQKVKGAKEAIYLIKNSDKFSSIFNDIIGDISSIISGGLGAVLALDISKLFGIDFTICTIIVASSISSLTIGGKAILKKVVVKKSDKILFFVGRLMATFKRK